MSTASYLNVLEHYHDYREPIRELLASMLTGMADPRMLDDPELQREAFKCLREQYPFVELLYVLDPLGIQVSDNIGVRGQSEGCEYRGAPARGRDRSQRPYYRLARTQEGVAVTEPYLSSASRELCVSAVLGWQDGSGQVQGYLVLDIDLGRTLEFLMGDAARRRFQPWFRAVYSVIVLGLMAVVGVLLYAAYAELLPLFTGAAATHDQQLKPFGIIIFLTLALAIFDLGKTVLEEEVLMHKDVYRHSSTRRTITRFIAAILIAVSIESLLLMFKAALGQGENLAAAVWMMLAAVGLLVGLGLYVYLGARAEHTLLAARRAARRA